MIVTCINRGKIKNLTEGKNYKVIREPTFIKFI